MNLNVHSLPCVPDKLAMSEMMGTLFAHSETGLIELAWTSASYPHKLTGGRHYGPHEIDDLIDEAARINAAPNRNVYVSAGLRKDSTILDRRAGDSDVEAIAALKIDCDEPGSFETAQQICAAMGIEPNFVMFTGREPHPRGALWWVLENPTLDLDRVRQLESGLVRKLGSDPAVVNPSRVMRLAGSVAWPLKEGRTLEMTGVETSADIRPRAYTLDEIDAALRAAGALEKPAPTAQVLDFNPAAAKLDLESLARAARAPGRWHDNALRAVAHVIGRGLPPDLAEDALSVAFTLPGYSVEQTRLDLRPMIAGAVKKWAPEPVVVPAGNDPFPLIEIDNIAGREPPEWRIDGLIPSRGLGVLYGKSGTFKTFLALDMALSVAHALPWRTQATKGGAAVYIAGEGTYSIANRVLVWRAHRAGESKCSGFWLAPVAADLLDRKMVALIVERLLKLPEKPVLVVIDTLARSFGSGDEKDTKDMNAFVAACDEIGRQLQAFVLVIHHAGKDEERGARGSSVLRAAADVEIKVSRSEGAPTVRLANTKQKDAEEAADVVLRLISAETNHPATGEILKSLIPIADEGTPLKRSGSVGLGRNQQRVLDELKARGTLAFGEIRIAIGIDDSSLGKALRALEDRGLIAKNADKPALWWPVTEGA